MTDNVLLYIILHIIAILQGGGYLGKLSLVLADDDEDYIDSFSNYLLKHHAQSFDIHTFSCVESLTAFFSDDTRRVNILLAGPGFIYAGIPSGSAEIIILLDCGNTDIQKGTFLEARSICGRGVSPVLCTEGVPSIKRYQHAEKLVSSIFSQYSAKNTAGRLPAGKSSTMITAFISPSGGAGKSVISAGCSILCAGRGMKVFYLNLEGSPSTGLYFKGNSDQNFSNVLYYLKDKEVNPDIRLAGASCVDVSTGVHFFLPPESQLEMSCLKPEDLKRLLDSFRSATVYDAVFIDMPGKLDECGITAMNAADRVVCICGPDSTSMFKAQCLQAELELLERRYITGLMEKTIHVLNDSRSIGVDSCYNPTGVKPEVVFKESQALRSATGGRDLLDCGVNFASEISMLLEKINPVWAVASVQRQEGKRFEA